MPAATTIQFGDNLTATDLGGGTVKVDASPALQAGSAVGDVLKWTGSNWQAATESNDYVKIAEVLAASPTANLIITGISQSYAHLKLVMSLRSTNASVLATSFLRANGQSGNLYYWARTSTVNSVVSGSSAPGVAQIYTGVTNANNAAGFSAHQFLFTDYTATGPKHGVGSSFAVGDGPATNMYQETFAGYASVGPISQVAMFLDAGLFAIGSRLTAYGMR